MDTIIPRLPDASSAADVHSIVHEEFVRWFSEDIAGPKARYAALAQEIWAAWRELGGTVT